MIKIITMVLVLASCAAPRVSKYQKYSPIAFDPMQSESLERLAWDGGDQFGNYPKELVLCYKGKFAEAFKLLNMKANTENDPKHWNVVGSCYYWKNDLAKARFYFEMGLAVDPQNIDLEHNLAMVYLMQGNDQLAVKNLLKITEKDSKNLLAKWNLALIYYSIRAPELAIKQLKLLQNIVPKDPLVGLMLMKSYIAQEKYDLALEVSARIPKEFQDSREYLNYQAYSYLKTGDLLRAEPLLKNLGTVKDPKDKEFYLELVKYLENLKTKQRNLATSQGEGV